MDDLNQFIARLSAIERAELMDALLKKSSWLPPVALSQAQLAKAEHWLRERTALAGAPQQRHSRARIWLIFMVLRYGGLRLREVLQLEEEDCRFEQNEIRTGQRNVPLPGRAASQLASFWSNWSGRTVKNPLACDPSYIRRSLATCARACGLNPSLLNASSLRRQRGLELEAGGLHPHLASLFLGKMEKSPLFAPGLAHTLLRKHIMEEGKMKTSARNVFHGRLTSVEENGILVCVRMETAQGLRLTAIVTQESSKNLGLAPGVAVNALVKAPFVTVSEKTAQPNCDNCFAGTVESLNRDALACEIAVRLPQGNQLCSLYANGASPSGEIKKGSEVTACFSPFSVILTAD